MRITNDSGLPEPFVRAVRATVGPDRNIKAFATVTELIAPAWQVALKRKHKAELTMDATDATLLCLGTAFHNWLHMHNADTTNVLAEERLTVTIKGHTISGAFDHYEDMLTSSEIGSKKVLYDYKTTSKWSWIFRDRIETEWTPQLNAYAYMLRQHGFAVNELCIVALFRDWSASEARRNPDYPSEAVKSIPIVMWSDDEVRAWLEVRVTLLEAALQGTGAVCSEEEQWAKPDTFAVMKGIQKRALRVLGSQDAAWAWIQANGDATCKIVHRPGERLRCAKYCVVSKYCTDYQSYLSDQFGSTEPNTEADDAIPF